MKNLACRYAVVQFMPYSETGEFANAGVVLVCPQTGYFDFHLQTRKYARVTAFFDELAPEVYLTAIKVIQGEMERVRDRLARDATTRTTGTTGTDELTRAAFTSLVHPREAIIRFSPARVLLAEEPEKELKRLFDHYVDRAFATPEYVETAMIRRLSALLKGLDLQAPFRAEKIGDDVVHANFPLVQRRGVEFRKVIKPFNLNQPEPNGIFDHGDAWVQKMRRLRNRNLLPAEVLFAVAGPRSADTKRFAAFREICMELERLDVLTVEEAAKNRIVEFAQA
jgi:hypothetical protein